MMMIADQRMMTLITIVTLALTLAFIPVSQAESDLPESGENNVWYTYNDSETVFVFVHGVLSDSRSAWTYEDENDPSKNTNWPRLIHEDPNFGDPSIFLGGFHTQKDSGDYGIRDAAKEFYRTLAISVDPADEAVLDKPNIVFITHSTGGIVVRHMLYRETPAFADKKVGLVLIASPSIGSKDADRLGLIAQVAEHRLGQELQWNHPFLEELDSDFKNLVNEKSLPGLVGTEWLEHHLIGGKLGRVIEWARGEVLVEKASAARYFGEPIRLRNTDHFSAVKPNNRRHPAYQNLRFFYEREFLPASDPAASKAADDGTTIINNQGVAAGRDIDTGGGDINVGGQPVSDMIGPTIMMGTDR